MKLVVVGANAAGLSAASKARRNDPEAEIIVIEKSGDISYGACGLPYFIGGDIAEAEKLIAVPMEDFRQKRNIDIRIFQEALTFDPRKKIITIRRMDDKKTYQLPYDRLIIATGARAVKPPIAGVDAKNVFLLRTLEDGRKIRRFLEEQHPQKVLIVGAGYIGLEMAEAFHKQGAAVYMVEMMEHVMPNMDADMAEWIAQELNAHEVKVFTSTALKEIKQQDSKLSAQLSNGQSLPVDMILISVGIKPNVELALSGGVELGRSGAIAINDRMQTNVRNVYAAGDCAEAKHLVTNKATYIPLGTTANKQGRIAGDNASGHQVHFKGITGTSAVKVFDWEVAMTGISTAAAEKIRLPVKSIVIKSISRAGYYPHPKRIVVKLLFSPQGGKLLGAQMVGGEGVAKRIDVLATALHQKMTVQDIAELDLSYSPPYAPVWDPLLVAANQAVKQVR